MPETELLKKIADLEEQIKKLEKDLIHDSLTSLKTRKFFEEEMGNFLPTVDKNATSKRREKFGFTNVSILFLDIDHFKEVNDTYGHDVGDIVLKKVAQTIEKSVRERDIVARWGGEEIAASLLGANEEEAKTKAEEIRKHIEKLKFPELTDHSITISIGVATNFPKATYNDLLKHADLALYKAKRTGRNKVVSFSEL